MTRIFRGASTDSRRAASELVNPGLRAAVVVPCFNEESRIDLDRFRTLLGDADVIFVDDGSTDGTSALLEPFVDDSAERAELVRLSGNVGKGEAVRHGMLHAIDRGAPVVGYLDADLATPIEEFVALGETLEREQLHVVLGARVKLLGGGVRRSLGRHVLGRIFATLASLLLRLPVYDTQCGAKVFRVTPGLEAALARPFTTRWVFDVELLARLMAHDPDVRDRMAEQPLRRWQDVRGSRLHTGASVIAILDLLRITGVARRAARRSAQHAEQR